MFQPVEILPALIPAGYLPGSVPFGLILGKARGIDPRQADSGNLWAATLGRLLGGKYFALIFCLDLRKGILPSAAAEPFPIWTSGNDGHEQFCAS